MRAYRGSCLLVGLAVANASDEDIQRLLPVVGLAVAKASDEDLQRLLPTGRTC
jgi:hypothetical protein